MNDPSILFGLLGLIPALAKAQTGSLAVPWSGHERDGQHSAIVLVLHTSLDVSSVIMKN